jgi:hypothetical protein
VGVLLALVGLVANVALGLWTRTTVDSVAYDAARHVATAPARVPDAVARRQALERATTLLGRYGERVRLDFEQAPGADVVVLRVRAPGVSLLPRVVDAAPTVGALDRRIVMAKEPA